MEIRSLTQEDAPALRALLWRQAPYNPFHLGALAEYGLAPTPGVVDRAWAVGALRGGQLAGAVMALRGTGGLYRDPGDEEALHALAEVVLDRAGEGSLTLLSGHASQLEPLLPLVAEAHPSRGDRCPFRVLFPGDLITPPSLPGFGAPRAATLDDVDRLADFYEVGFYSLARLPSRQAWRNRLSEQIALRTVFFMEDREGRVVAAAQSSAEGGEVAMLGGVATLTHHRGQGLSALCTGALCRYLFDKGAASISLFYMTDNLPAERVYDKLGFRYDGEWLLVPVGFGGAFHGLLGMRPTSTP